MSKMYPLKLICQNKNWDDPTSNGVDNKDFEWSNTSLRENYKLGKKNAKRLLN